MPIQDITNNPESGDVSPGNPGYWQFYKQGSAVSSGAQIDSEGNAAFAGTVTATGGVVSNGPASYIGAAAGTTVIAAQVAADLVSRFTVSADGTLQWGGGAVALDVNLYRYAANGLATDDALKLAAAAILLLGAAGDVNLYRSATGELATDNNLVAAVAGKGLQIKEGANAKMGVSAALTAGTIVISTTAVTAASRIYLTAQTSGAAPGALRVSARTAGASFTITSTSVTDTSTVAWMLVEPAA